MIGSLIVHSAPIGHARHNNNRTSLSQFSLISEEESLIVIIFIRLSLTLLIKFSLAWISLFPACRSRYFWEFKWGVLCLFGGEGRRERAGGGGGGGGRSQVGESSHGGKEGRKEGQQEGRKESLIDAESSIDVVGRVGHLLVCQRAFLPLSFSNAFGLVQLSLEENDTQMFQAPLATAAGGGEGGKDGGLEREVVGEIGKLHESPEATLPLDLLAPVPAQLVHVVQDIHSHLADSSVAEQTQQHRRQAIKVEEVE